MKINVLKAKVKRNNLIKNAGKFYVNEASELIQILNKQGKSALLGIQNKKKGVYTIIGKQFVYYLTSSGTNGKIPLKQFTDELHENGIRKGTGCLRFRLLYKNIVLSNGDKVWLYNSDTMFSIWNTVLWLQELPAANLGDSDL